MLERQVQTFSELGTKTFYNIFLVANSFVWYFALLSVFDGWDPLQALPILVVHFCGLMGSAIVGAKLGKKVDRMRFLVFWITLTTVASFTFPLLNQENALFTTTVVLFLGISFGLGMPTCMSLFTDSIPVQNRGRASGLTIFVTGIGIFALAALPINEGIMLAVVLAIWRMVSLFVLRSAKWPIRAQGNTDDKGYKKIIGQRAFALYFIPWLMFSFVNYLIAPMTDSLIASTSAEKNMVFLVQTVFMGAFALVGGFLADSVGRKRLSIAGFTLLGIGTAVLAMARVQDLPIVLYFNAAVDGVALGFLFVLFIVLLWGDLSYNSRSDKFYAIGVLPFFLSRLLELTIGAPLAFFVSENRYAFFSFTAFFLLIAVLPLVYAPETLPELVIKDRDLKSYVEKAQKQALRLDKEIKNTRSADITFQVIPEEEESDEYKRAKELAEKCY